LREELIAWGADEQTIASAMAAASDPDFEVEPENWPALVLFMRCQTQWNVGGMGHRIGLNYAGVEVVARIGEQPLTVELFDALQLLEITTLNELSRRANGQATSRSRHLG
jgi:hypothetical protein